MPPIFPNLFPDTVCTGMENLILIIRSVCLCHCERLFVPCYFLAPCNKHKHTGHAHQQAASQASTDSAWRHSVWLPHSSCGFQRPVGLACEALLRLTPQATIARSAIVTCNINNMRQWRTDAYHRVVSRDPRNKLHQIRGISVDLPDP